MAVRPDAYAARTPSRRGPGSAARTVRFPAALVTTGCTVVDGGRPGLAHLGIPRGGVADRELWAAALVICGDAPGTAVLEAGPGPFSITAEGAEVLLAVAGGCRLRLEHGEDRRAAAPWRTLRLSPGTRLSGSRVGPGCRVVVAVAGGIGTTPILGSRSPMPGTVAGERLDGVVPVHAAGRRGPDRRLIPPTWLLPPTELEVVPGPQAEALDPAGWAALSRGPWRIDPVSGRGGIRLDGPRLEAAGPTEVPSQGVGPGAVQLPAGGRPVILMCDRGTTGGYPVIATVVSADLAGAARLRPGADVQIRVVDAARAGRRRGARQRAIAGLARHLRDTEETA